mgnify:CR=1 FL=1
MWCLDGQSWVSTAKFHQEAHEYIRKQTLHLQHIAFETRRTAKFIDWLLFLILLAGVKS